MKRGAAFIACAVLLITLSPMRSDAAFHVMMVREVFAGSAAEPQAQYIELQMWAGGQNFVQGHSVIVYDAAGSQAGTFTFASNVGNGSNQSTILLATSDAQLMFGVTADLAMTPVVSPGGGKICFDTIDCVSWGSYSGSAGGVGTPFNSSEGIATGGTMGRDITRGSPTALDGADDTNVSAVDFQHVPPAPRNNAGSVGNGCCPTFSFTAASYSVDEPGSVDVTVARTNDSAGDSVIVNTRDASAVAPDDYPSVSQTLNFAAGVDAMTITLSANADELDECDERFDVTIRSPGTALLGRADASVIIDAPLRAPGTPMALTAIPETDRIRLTWQPPVATCNSPIDGYRVYGGDASGVLALVATVFPTTHTEGGLGTGVTRFYQVSAFNIAGESPRTNEVASTTLATASAPRSLSAVAGPERGEIRLSWQPPLNPGGSPVSGYRIYSGTTATNTVALADVGPVATYLHQGLPDGVTRFYRLRALNDAGEGASSATVNARTFSIPSEPRSVSANPGSAIGEIVVSWVAPSSTGGVPILSYDVRRARAGGPESVVASSSGMTFVDRNLEPATSYTYRITAVNIVGSGPGSATSCTKPFPWVATLRCTI